MPTICKKEKEEKKMPFSYYIIAPLILSNINVLSYPLKLVGYSPKLCISPPACGSKVNFPLPSTCTLAHTKVNTEVRLSEDQSCVNHTRDLLT